MKRKQFSQFYYEEFHAISEKSLVQCFCDSLPNRKLFFEVQDDLLLQAFTHKSFSHENGPDWKNNERLEFLGDCVLDLIISKILFEQFPNKSEGELSKFRSALVNEDSLKSIANHLDLGGFLLLGKGELKNSGHEKGSILADVFEALLGAYFSQFGFEKTYELFNKLINLLEKKTAKQFIDFDIVKQFDAKTTLQEITMKQFKILPEYKCTQVKDDFLIECFIKDTKVASLVSNSKKKGMQQIAKEIIDKNLYKMTME